MKYEMIVVIADPKDVSKKVTYNLKAEFLYDSTDYGNGHYLYIAGEKFTPMYYDLRYVSNFNRNRKEEWLLRWAYSCWSGENGAYKVVEFSIKEVEEDVEK